MARKRLSCWLGERVAARPTLDPYPSWVLGSGERRGIAVRIRGLIWPRLKDEFEVEWMDGLRLLLQPGSETSRAIYVTGRYEPNEFCLLDRILQPGMIFVDVGANVGLYSLFAATKVKQQGRVLAIEPSSREYEVLIRNLQANRLQNVCALRVAVWDRRGSADLLVAPLEHSGHNTLGGFGYGTTLERQETVPLERLDEIIRGQGLERVDVIKIDVEGAELFALQGAAEILQRFHPMLLLEVSDRTLQHQGSSSRSVLEWLQRHGYSFYSLDSSSGLPQPLQAQGYFESQNTVAVVGESTPW
jgi:FkbM family methyltransferase